MINKIQYAELRDSIISGCDIYLNALKNKKNLDGYFHGTKGRIRALKAQTYASHIVNDHKDDHFLLLALLLAIFNTSSKGLAMCITAQLIQGEKLIVGAYDNDYFPVPVMIKDTLSSPVFSHEILNSAALSSLIEVEDSPCGPVLGPDKKQCVRWILNHQSPRDTFFKNLTNQFKADLDNTKSSEIDPTMLDHSLANF